MGFILKLLGGSVGPWLAAGVAVMLAGLLLTITIDAALLKHAKADLREAKGAQIDPATKRKWQIEAVERGSDLKTCRENTGKLQSSIDAQNASVAALKAEGDRRTAEAEKALQAARTATTAANRKASAVLAAKPGPDSCASAFDILKGAAG